MKALNEFILMCNLKVCNLELNENETDGYFLQNFQCTTMLIQVFCMICDHEIVLTRVQIKTITISGSQF